MHCQLFNSQVFDCEELHSHEYDNTVPKNPENDRYKTGEGYHAIPPPYTGAFLSPKPDLVFTDDPNASESVANVFNVESNETEIESVPKQREPTFVKSFKHVKTSRSLNHLIKDCDYYEKQMVQNPVWNSSMRVNHQNSVRMTHPHSNRNVVPTAVLTRLRLVSLNAARHVPTTVTQSTVKNTWPVKHVGNPQQALKDKGVIDNGCSRHMTGNISFLLDFKEIDGGYVASGGNPKGDTECVVLSSDYKLPNENHVLLRVLRENNMYNVDLKNVVPSGGLTCLFAKATFDESNLWHRRLGHINFKTMNKLVKGNLVRGLPLKIFENKHTCVACQKEKQHKASYPLGKFDGKADEGFLVRYSVNSKAFRVFNSRTRIVQETLHINFLENKPNVVGIGPKCLFDIDTLTLFMNFPPVVAGNQPNDNAGIKENIDPDMPKLEDIVYSDDEEDVGAEADLSNLETNIPMDVKSVFLYGTIKKEVYVCQPLGFEDHDYPDKVYKVVKALYGLHQAPRAWYETLANYLLENGFQRGTIDQTLFIKKQTRDTLLVQVYVDDIIFGSTNKELCKAFEKLIKDKFQMNVKSASTSIETEKPLLKDPYGEDVDVHIYSARFQVTPKVLHLHAVKRIFSDYVGASLDRKSTTRVYQFLGCRLISWQCKKQIVVATSSTEAEYVAAASYRDQVLWIQNQLLDYGVRKAAKVSVAVNTLVLFEAQQISNESPLLGVNSPRCDEDSIELKELMVSKSDASEGFDQIMDFLNARIIQYALVVNPTIYVSCIKQFWATATVKKVNDDVQLRTLIDGKKCLCAKRTAWNEFSCSMASAIIFLATVVLDNQVDDMSTYNTRYTSTALTQKVFTNMRRVGKGFSGVETPLFASMLVQSQSQAKEEVEIPIAPTPPSTISAPSPHTLQDPTPTTHATPPQDQPLTPHDSPP
nr:hypothetical protein [Tanacetum cinerariifolium]